MHALKTGNSLPTVYCSRYSRGVGDVKLFFSIHLWRWTVLWLYWHYQQSISPGLYGSQRYRCPLWCRFRLV